MGTFINKKVAARRRRGRIRSLILLLVLIAAGALLDPAIVAPFGPIAERPERVEARFTRCGQGPRSPACVVDGDSFRLGSRAVRITGIDAPELGGASCPAERALGERAADRLVALLNEGPVDLVAHRFHGTDRYGRDLRGLTRDGRSLGDVLQDEGLAHRYVGMKRSWC